MGGRSGGSRDAIMRNLLAENLEKASTRRTVAAITERNPSDANTDVAEAETESQPAPTVQVQGAVQAARVEPAAPPPVRSTAPTLRAVVSAATAAMPPQGKSDAQVKSDGKSEPAPLTNGVIQTQPIAAIPGSSEPMKPVKVKTVHIKAGQVKLASAGSAQPATPVTNAISARPEVPETSTAVMAKAETGKPDYSKVEMPPQPANHGTGNGILGVLPASSVPSASPTQAMAYADPTPRSQPQPQTLQQSGAIKPEATHTGWIVQVGALDSESEARQRIEAALSQAHGLLNKADPFT
jgi:D-alanyl-D-alanine carboxypeptidase